MIAINLSPQIQNEDSSRFEFYLHATEKSGL